MATHKSAIKRHRQSLKRRAMNRARKSELKTWIKKVRTAQDKETARAAYNKVVSLLDKLATKGIIHKNKASNQKSKLALFINKLEK
ncbi:MAG: 30S ribosomal protein S20 [Ignavibacteria bacterium]|jgi:small subunit ribosomal protein S20|nr:30S ribosomal protein S20 [Ignavibacteria bacterium]MDH7528267.1 30S ribosomal protein S20 [Ignavibacteria bacterium]NPV12573.1 30S ribosomal protein S20 [Ignavibacteria bacterium]